MFYSYLVFFYRYKFPFQSGGVWWPISLIRNNHCESEYEFEIEFKIEFEVQLK